ncbi:L-rhamnose mutarotase [Streptosporangiaceae bacterium NEAU-GS5]|nr:L-rhamnose mutarotase [Streptosporangiaceae bacterium NEAU-GS5]
MQRVCFLLRVRPELVDEYRRRHAEVWPEMRAALSATGWHNYSIFVADDGQVIGYVETDDFEGALSGMAATEVNARWQRQMAPFFEGIGGAAPDTAMRPVPEAFHLD